MSDETPPPTSFEIRTMRPTVGVIGGPLASDDPGPALVDSILDDLDRGDGWVWRSSHCWSWHPGRLRIDFSLAWDAGAPSLSVDAVVVRNASRQPAVLAAIDDLNVHAGGWWWWIDLGTGDISASMRCVVKKDYWWWPQVVRGVLPLFAAVTESMADQLARTSGGDVADEPHPERGTRRDVDGWIQSCRMGQREPSAVLNLWLSALELNRMLAAIQTLVPGIDVRLSHPLALETRDDGDRTRVVLRQHWHPELGWGWQLATIPSLAANTGDRTEARGLAAKLNQRQAHELHRNRLGGWIALEGVGVVHQTFIPACVTEVLLGDARETIGDVTALMLEVTERWNDIIEVGGPGPHVAADPIEELHLAQFKSGPIGASHMSPTAPSQDDSFDETWLIPRHQIVCTYGYFNPMGPTVSSLEVTIAFDGPWRLWHVLRHPFSPQIDLVGEGAAEDLDELITDVMSNPEVVGSSPEWLEINAYHDAVTRGVYELAAGDDETDWRTEADALVWFSSDPWARVSDADPPPADASPWLADANPAACWVEAITDLNVIAGHQLFLRSAWEGAAAYAGSGFEDAEAAQSVAETLRDISRQRAFADFAFRGEEPPLVKHPLSHDQST